MDIKIALIAVADMPLFTRDEIENELREYEARLQSVNRHLSELVEIPKLGVSQNQLYALSKTVSSLKQLLNYRETEGIREDSRVAISIVTEILSLDKMKLSRLDIEVEEAINNSYEIANRRDTQEERKHALLGEQRMLEERVEVCKKALEALSRLNLTL